MKIVYMGTPEFAVPAMVELNKHHEIVGVITAPDKPAGRGKKLKASAVKIAAMDLGLHLLQPTNLKDPQFQSELEALNAELFVVVAFRMLPMSVWGMPKKGTINLHGSLLPQYRGAAPINRAIMNGETETGLTTFFIEKDIDTGKVIDREKLTIGPDETAGSLHDRMMVAGASLLVQTVNKIEKNKAHGISQQELAEANTLREAPKIFREHCQINWNLEAQEIHNHIRGLSPFPAAWTKATSESMGDETYKIIAASVNQCSHTESPGQISIEGGHFYVYARNGKLKIEEIQAPGKKRMKTADFLRGFQVPEGFKFQ